MVHGPSQDSEICNRVNKKGCCGTVSVLILRIKYLLLCFRVSLVVHSTSDSVSESLSSYLKNKDNFVLSLI